MKEETARALTLAACALQAYALAKSFKREVIDPYRFSVFLLWRPQALQRLGLSFFAG